MQNKNKFLIIFLAVIILSVSMFIVVRNTNVVEAEAVKPENVLTQLSKDDSQKILVLEQKFEQTKQQAELVLQNINLEIKVAKTNIMNIRGEKATEVDYKFNPKNGLYDVVKVEVQEKK